VSASVLYMSMSLDGYIAGSDDQPDNPGGDGFMRLHEWLAAGDRDVLVHGAYTAQRALEAGVLDELQIHQIPVLFGQGCRLFDGRAGSISLRARSATRRGA
jgi:dihydrofolate reductase